MLQGPVVARRPLGRSGLQVPVLGMGTWRTFDTDDDRKPIVELAIRAGIDLFDSSPMYGKAEATLADALDGRRHEVLVATKVWTPDAREGRRQAERALRLFGHVDIYQVHNLVNWKDHLDLLEELRDAGSVDVAGATHYQVSAFNELMTVMRTGRVEMIQIPYGPAVRDAEAEVLPLAEELGIGVLVMSPLQHGILDRRPGAADLATLGCRTWPAAIIKWIASDPRVSCVLSATSNRQHLEDNAAGAAEPWFDSDQRDLVVRMITS